ncbi:phage late control D family protein [Paeniglutamicibacter psychrophenolicus]|uniref:Phage protein D n=1 Tax=Paeniglutamicibacter psychrophenolicus TaxID=257454 RepID=A0ABS4WG38_9MICC|nr:phage late control D family protein [Paeniglutamicibacter psychrophenolicus]MBP2375163.1 phage protein D [Paeniglutamicibacter psychrophenolicus]
MSQPFFADRQFHTPAFSLVLNGADLGQAVTRDVLEVSFTDELEVISSFDFSLYDWDAEALHPRYSSPWGPDGRPSPMGTGSGQTVPNFEPGARVDLHFGYVEEGALPLMLRGEVVSLSPTFPASGVPTCRVRALEAFQRGLQKIHVEGNYTGTDKAIIARLCADENIKVRFAALENEGKSHERVAIDGTLYDEIATRAKEYGLLMVTEPGDPPGLFLAAPTPAGAEPVAELRWGVSLKEFTPVLSTAAAVAEVVVRRGDPEVPAADRQQDVIRRFSDIGLDPAAIGPAGVADLQSAVRGIREVIKPDEVLSAEDAIKAADAHLRELAGSLITGNGSTVGLPELRAGALLRLSALGARFDGTYRITKAVHAIGGSGYTTTFAVRKEVLGA